MERLRAAFPRAEQCLFVILRLTKSFILTSTLKEYKESKVNDGEQKFKKLKHTSQKNPLTMLKL